MATRIAEIVNTEWTKITTVGDHGTCWKKSDGGIFVCSTDQEGGATLPLSNTNVTLNKAKRVPLDEDSPEVLQLNPLSPDDAFYALSLKDSAQIVVDSLLENLGPELITVAADRDFSAGQGNWTVSDPAEITFDNVSMNWACTAINFTTLVVTLTEGTLCRVELEIIDHTTGEVSMYLGEYVAGGLCDSAAVFVYYITAGSADWFKLYGTTDFESKVDNISIKECL